MTSQKRHAASAVAEPPDHRPKSASLARQAKMMDFGTPRISRLIAFGLSPLLIATALLAAPASGEPISLRDALLGKHGKTEHGANIAAGRYLPEEGEAFVVEPAEGQHVLLVRFEDNPEVYVLRPTAAPRGDVIYKNDVDEPMLRATRLGGLTVFTDAHPLGAAAAPAPGETNPLRLAPIASANALLQSMVQASRWASHAAQHLVVFEAPDLSAKDITPAGGAVFADAAWLAAQAFNRLAAQGKDGRLIVQRYDKVEFANGKAASATVTGAVVQITVCTDKGYAGRPSSKRILAVLKRK
ncbi:MAG: DUF4908 domain-containing protein [Pseudomonadota bacterium]